MGYWGHAWTVCNSRIVRFTFSSSLHSVSRTSRSSRDLVKSSVNLDMSEVRCWLAVEAWSSCSLKMELTWARLPLLQRKYDNNKNWYEQGVHSYKETVTTIMSKASMPTKKLWQQIRVKETENNPGSVSCNDLQGILKSRLWHKHNGLHNKRLVC